MNTHALEEFKKHAAQEYPREACGVLVAVGKKPVYVPCLNLSTQPDQQFQMDPRSYRAAAELGEVLAICHSHPDASAKPSEGDVAACNVLGVPWFILSWPGAELERLEPTGYKAPLVGRTFVHGIHDCYSLIRDYYKEELSIVLPDFERADEWWFHGENLYVKNFAKAGFSVVQEARKHDVFLMQVQAPVTNHAAINLGGTQILHHLFGQLSGRTVYGGYWQKCTTHILRHHELANR